MKVLGIELDFDFADADDLEKYEKAFPVTIKELESIKWNEENASSSVRKFCDAIFKFFDEIFGKGSSEKMFNGKRNYQKCLNAFKEIMDIKKDQDAEINTSLEYLENYSPNRVKRS